MLLCVHQSIVDDPTSTSMAGFLKSPRPDAYALVLNAFERGHYELFVQDLAIRNYKASDQFNGLLPGAWCQVLFD